MSRLCIIKNMARAYNSKSENPTHLPCFLKGLLFMENSLMQITQELLQELLHELFEYRDGMLFHKANKIWRGKRAGSKRPNSPHRIVQVNGKPTAEHRVIFMMFHGHMPKYVRHLSEDLNEDGLFSNLISNLREASNRSYSQREKQSITSEFLHEWFYYDNGRLFNKTLRRNSKIGTRAGSKNTRYPYQSICIFGKRYNEHRLIFLMFHGYLPKMIDHISDDLTEEGIKSNKIENLRPITNARNLQKSSKNKGAHKYRGVYFDKRDGSWSSRIRFGGKNYYLGVAKDMESAARLYDKAVKEKYNNDPHAFLNFPND